MTASQFDPKLIASFDQDMAAIDKMVDVGLDALQTFRAMGGDTFAIARMYADLRDNEDISRDRFIELFVGALSRLAARGDL